jgi:hypothetical protein
MDWRWLSTTVELVGTLVTSFGLFYAYGRATGLPARLRELWNRIRHGPRNITVDAAPMAISVGMGTADVVIAFTLDDKATDDEKFAAIQAYVRELRAMFGPVNAEIARLDKAGSAARYLCLM